MKNYDNFIKRCKYFIDSESFCDSFSDIQDLFERYCCNDYSLFGTLLCLDLNIKLNIMQNIYHSESIDEILIGDLEWSKKEWNKMIDKLKEQNPPTLFVKENNEE